MTDLVTSAQMRAIERAAIESGSLTGLALMERAGVGVVAACLARFPGAGRALVLCGPGNNGGDGFVVARLLRQHGRAVVVLFYGDVARLPADARTNFDRWCALGPVSALTDANTSALTTIDSAFGETGPDLIVDALFGTGLTRDLPSDVASALVTISDWRHRQPADVAVVAVDTPSGLCADSGRARGCGLRADLTVTFHAAKPGQYLAEGPEWCGALAVVDIGLPQWPADGRPAAEVVQLWAPSAQATMRDTVRDTVRETVRETMRKSGGHKYTHGHALILAGGVGKGGAGRLAARAALRIGAGVVTLGVPPAAVSENAARLDAVMVWRVAGPEALAEALGDPRISALCLGPGLGLDRARGLVPAALTAPDAGSAGCGDARPPRGVVLDADALTAFSETPAALFALLQGQCVLTPHWGEFRRLFPDLAASLAASLAANPGAGALVSKCDVVRAAARRAGCVVLLKGPDTVIASADGRCAIHAAVYGCAVPWLATAGAGDVLAGFITGLMARGVAPFEAACTAAWLHAEAARSFGPGLIAEDLSEALPAVLRTLVPGDQ